MTKSNRWTYGDSWEKYSIEAGQLWRAGESQVAAHDLFDGLPDYMLEADLIYTDSPWNTGNINSFYTKAGIDESRTFEEFTKVLFHHIAAIAPVVCYLEIGKQNVELFKEAMADQYKAVQTWQVTYYRKKPSYLVRGSQTPTSFDFSGYDDMDTPILAMQHENFNCVADLCMGRGLTGISAYKLGKKFVGTELNKRRLAVLIDKTTQMGAMWSH
ncbi:MAG: hypothetical protein WC119_07380 [Synergistaceae bacterium]|jgi:hypothetical protein|nr:hypothetical protein [Candidatus Omnitrophota bacterium]